MRGPCSEPTSLSLTRQCSLFLLPLLLAMLPSALFAQGSVSYFGQVYSGDSFVWCVDGSESMFADGRWDNAREQTILALQSLDPGQEFSLVVYNTIVAQFSPSPTTATDDNIIEAISWLQDLAPISTTCMTNALLAAVGHLQMASNPNAAMFLVGDGPPACIGENATSVISATTTANLNGAPIHTLLLDDTAGGVSMFQSIAEQNNGIFRNLDSADQLFVRGDANGDGVVTGLLDAIFILNYQFVAGSPAPTCFDAADADDSGSFVGLLDGLFILNYQFSGSIPPPAPGPTDCGTDPTFDPLGCVVSICP